VSVDRLTSGRFEKSHTGARLTAKGQLEFILANSDALLTMRNGAKLLKDAGELSRKIEREELTPNQYNYIDGILESTWKALGFPSVDRHKDRKFNLRHG
jgi:hypothetical protein